MYRYIIYVFTVENNEIICKDYLCRHFAVNNRSLIIYPYDFSEHTYIHLDSNMRFEIIPYRHYIET